MSWRDVLPNPGNSSSGVFEGRVAQDAASVGDKVKVTLDSFDREQMFGPAPWMPRVDDAGEPVLPNNGDRCVVALAETDEPSEPEVWILAWYPYD